MSKKLTKFLSILLIIICILSTNFVTAANYDTEIMPISEGELENSILNSIKYSQEENKNTKNNDICLMEKNTNIDYNINGNLFVFSETVTIDSQINGDAFIMANKIIIKDEAYIHNNLFSVSDNIIIEGIVNNAFILSRNTDLSEGYINNDLKVACNTININGVIGRNAYINCENINFNSEGTIYGNLEYSSKYKTSIPENAVSGEIIYTQIIEQTRTTMEIISHYIFDLGMFLAFVLILWLICLWIAPKFLNNTNKFIGKSTLKAFGYGVLSLFLIPIACIILLLLQLTSSISLLLLVLYIIALALAKTIFTITANNYICSKLKIKKNTGIFGMLIATSFVVWIITKLPYVGGFISLIINTIGLGILILSIIPKRDIKNDNETKTIEIQK